MAEDSEFQQHLIDQLYALIEGMKALNQAVVANTLRSDRYDAEFTKLSQQNIALRGEMLDFKSELGQLRAEFAQLRTELMQFRSEMGQQLLLVHQRLEAIVLRIEELEAIAHDNSRQIQELRLEARNRFSELLALAQGNLERSSAFRELVTRVERLERRVGL